MKRLDRAAAVIFGCAALLCAVFVFLYRGAAESPVAEIAVDGKVVEKIPLFSAPREITVRSSGGFNVVRVGDGRAAVVSADCPDKVCVRTGEISRAGEGAVCLPHKLVVRITGGEGADVDALSR